MGFAGFLLVLSFVVEDAGEASVPVQAKSHGTIEESTAKAQPFAAM